MNVIGLLSGRIDNNLLRLANLPTFGLIVELVDGVRALSFLTGVPENDIPNMLRCRYTPLDWEKVEPDELKASIAFLSLAQKAVTEVLKCIASPAAENVQQAARDALEFVVETHRAVRRVVAADGVDTDVAREVTLAVVERAAPDLAGGKTVDAYMSARDWIQDALP